jgi:hypothetical protein
MSTPAAKAVVAGSEAASAAAVKPCASARPSPCFDIQVSSSFPRSDALRVRSGTLVRQAAGYLIIVRIFEQAIEILQNSSLLSGNLYRKPAKLLRKQSVGKDS